ncbi:MAG TPA: tRNA (adenosine(37)-N6)-threonylcarbamoyltransferase complex ATPase subunit type 1 TsaE, partial [Bacteroidota bacterium]|nr:tRNA (adenosine(37)-N6)-threonylcarbamoyltransferase complex ATPase subunit type 1 TsaE [Bacteroidota bacterium]
MSGGGTRTSSGSSTVIRSTSEAATVSEGGRLGSRLVPGDVVAITGGLGTGKTLFVRGLCGALGTERPVSSPTFTLVHEYPARGCTVYHFDFYRIRGAEELTEIGFSEYLGNPGGICVIEWADRVADHLPPDRYDVF